MNPGLHFFVCLQTLHWYRLFSFWGVFSEGFSTLKLTCGHFFQVFSLLALSREWMGMGEWGNYSFCGSFPHSLLSTTKFQFVRQLTPPPCWDVTASVSCLASALTAQQGHLHGVKPPWISLVSFDFRGVMYIWVINYNGISNWINNTKQ